MPPAEISLVQTTFHQLLPVSGQTAALFYARLFELDPTLRAIFRGDMREQGQRLMQTLATSVASLHQPDRLLDSARKLGARHHGYGVRDEHYATVGTAWLWTLEKVLGTDFTPAARAAWTNLYYALAHAMMDGARAAVVAA